MPFTPYSPCSTLGLFPNLLHCPSSLAAGLLALHESGGAMSVTRGPVVREGVLRLTTAVTSGATRKPILTEGVSPIDDIGGSA
ncbi:uncharacterized protein N7503_006357 [Penicillium pulvis]|uniref:uncharacterized protein n=1 Tax=Penicillium pulvis TaxID=1562058 RepID=UPI002546FFB1|nr:uncharacterized protein N7503_006357 [Penicillium pulvis]KAJ5798852.1 hypothetical protein N7503_006357 [Penicillium pulvis]